MISNDFFRLSFHLHLNWCLLICLFAFPSSCYPFDYRTYAGIVESMISLQALYPELVELSSTQKDFNLTSKLRCGITPCEQWYLRIYNKRIHSSSRCLPQLFVSGELHGDERVAPNAVLEYAILLLQNRANYDSSYGLYQSIKLSTREEISSEFLSPVSQSELPSTSCFSCRYARDCTHADG